MSWSPCRVSPIVQATIWRAFCDLANQQGEVKWQDLAQHVAYSRRIVCSVMRIACERHLAAKLVYKPGRVTEGRPLYGWAYYATPKEDVEASFDPQSISKEDVLDFYWGQRRHGDARKNQQ